jgi:hypothetical protein
MVAHGGLVGPLLIDYFPKKTKWCPDFPLQFGLINCSYRPTNLTFNSVFLVVYCQINLLFLNFSSFVVKATTVSPIVSCVTFIHPVSSAATPQEGNLPTSALFLYKITFINFTKKLPKW